MGNPILLEKSFVGWMFEWFFDEREGVELQKLVSFGKVSSLRIEVFPKGRDFFLRNLRLSFKGGVYAVDEEVDPQIELQLFLISKQPIKFHELLPLALVEGGHKFLFPGPVVLLVVEMCSLYSSV